MSLPPDWLQIVGNMYDHKMKSDRAMWRLLIAEKDKRIQELLVQKTKSFSFDMMEDFPSVSCLQLRYRMLMLQDRQDIVDELSELYEDSTSLMGLFIQDCFDQSSHMYFESEQQMIQTAVKNVGLSKDNSILQNSFASWCRKNFKVTTVYQSLKKRMEDRDLWKQLYVKVKDIPSLKSKWGQFTEDCCTYCWWMHCSADKLVLQIKELGAYPCLMGQDLQVLVPGGKKEE